MKTQTPEQMIKDNLLVKMLSGSHAYGTNTQSSDIDYRGIFCANPIHVRTPFFNVEECKDPSEGDTKIYELSKFMKLYLECSPNIVELLWTDPSDIVETSVAYKYLRQFNKLLLSSKAAFTFSGYALAQIKRLKSHYKWINNPQTVEAPRQIDFVTMIQWFGAEKKMPRDFHLSKFREGRLIPYGNNIFGLTYMQGYETYSDDYTLNRTFDGSSNAFEGERHKLAMPLAIVKFNEEEYRRAKEVWEQYWTWKANRNKTRAALEEKLGYDSKHAMHTVRLLRMGVEILRDQVVIVKRPDAQELLDIRNGAWSYDQLIKYAEELDKEVREVWYKKTSLPKTPDIKLAATVLMGVQDLVWEQNYLDRTPIDEWKQ